MAFCKNEITILIYEIKKRRKIMLKKEIYDLLNAQINKELFSAYLYLDISNHYIDKGLMGFGHWYDVQAMEEKDHAYLMKQYIQNNGESVVLEMIKKPSVDYKTLRTGIEESLAHERYISNSINHIYEKALELNDYKTVEFLNWFIKEQVEEEKNAEDLLKQYDMFASDGKGLYMMDKDLLARVYAAPSLVLD